MAADDAAGNDRSAPDALTPDAPLMQVTRLMATYNLLALPVVDAERRLLGAISVDDVLDHLLPDDWRESEFEASDRTAPTTATGVDRV